MVKVYELNLPVFNILTNKGINNDNSDLGALLGEFTSNEIDILIEKNMIEQLEIASSSNEEDDWINENQQLGDLGELIAEAYLREKYEEVRIVSKDASLGYDIEANNGSIQHQYEVKTSRNHFGFHITKNELSKAANYQDTYHIFFIKLNEEDAQNIDVTAYIIKNPIHMFRLNIQEIFQVYTNPIISYRVDNLFVRLKPSKLGVPIDLTYII